MKRSVSLRRISLLLAVALCLGLVGGSILTRKTDAVAEGETGYEAIYSSDNPVPEIAANVRPSVV